MVSTPKPNGFADHYPVFKWLFHWEYIYMNIPYFQTNPFASALNSVLIGLVHPLRSKPPGKSCCQTNAVTFRFKFCAQAVCKKCAVFSSKTYEIHDFLSSSTSSKHLTHFDARVKMTCFFLMAGFEDLRIIGCNMMFFAATIPRILKSFVQSFVPSHIPMMASNRATALLGKFLPGIAT